MAYYKAFEKGLICRGKQYAENTIFEELKGRKNKWAKQKIRQAQAFLPFTANGARDI